MNGYINPRKALLWIVAAGFFMQTLDSTIVNSALPSVARSFGENPLSMRPVVVAYTLTMAMLTPASGWLADRFGTRTTYLVSILLFCIGSVLCAVAPTLEALVAARILQGAGGAMLMPVGRLAILRGNSAGDYIAAIATVSVAAQAGPLLGPTLGGWLVEKASWQWIFLINVPIGLVGLLAVRRYVPAGSAVQAPPFDFRGCALLSLSMVAFSLAMDAPVEDHAVLFSVCMLALSALSAAAYLPHARRNQAPLFRLGLFREPNFSVGLLGNLLARIGSSAVPFLVPLLLQVQLGYGPLRAGLMMIPTALAGIFAKTRIKQLVDRYGYERFLRVNTSIMGASIVSFALISPDWPLWAQVLQLGVFGGASSLQFSAMNSVTLKGLRPADAGGGNSLFSMVQMLALGLGASVGGGLLELFSEQMESTARAFRYTFAVVGGFTLMSGAVFRRLDDDSAGTASA